MREALSGLTVRGRAFLAAGVTAMVCAVLLGQDALTRVGVLVLALPLVTAWVMGRSSYRLSLGRDLSPHVVPAGQPARVTLTISNQGRTPNGALLLEDQVPYVLGTRPRFVLDGIGRGWKREVTYQVRSDVRGRFSIGPMSIRVLDPFGLIEIGRVFRTTTSLVVTPRVTPLPQINLGGSGMGSGDNRTRAFAVGSAEDVTVRDYRRGDDLRRVHWPSSARMGELMVRREEQPWHSRATVFLDNRAVAHRGQGVASSLETAVAAAASVAVHLSSRGYSVRLVTAAGESGAGARHHRESDATSHQLLEALAVIEPLKAPHIETGWLDESGSGGLTIGVFGAVAAGDLPVVRRMKQHAGVALALSLDVEAWASSGAGSPAAVLAHQGWRTVSIAPDTRLDQAWRELGHIGMAGRHITVAASPVAGRTEVQP
ncbi:MAG: DUF58 domain-containing protein [Nocardioides sp.]|nr:DUF58 domain-containing protein [Nocardioides sp.]